MELLQFFRIQKESIDQSYGFTKFISMQFTWS